MSRPRDPLLQHLENALRMFGADLPVPVPPRDPAQVAAADDADDAGQVRRPPRFGRDAAAGPTAAGRSQTASQKDVPTTQADVPALPRPGPTRPPAAAASPATAAPPPAARATPATAAATPDTDDPLDALRREVMACRRCKLCESRRTVVFGEGATSPKVMFVGEAPGAVEDRMGRPFVGPAGELLDRIIEGGMGLRREDVFIANVNKCRPPGNRNPEPDEVAACLPFLQRQVALLQPPAIVALGRVAAHNLLATDGAVGALRGREFSYAGIPVVVTWHPAFLLREPARKAETWADIQRVNRLLGRPEDPRRG